MSLIVASALASFAYVFLRAFQQLNVQGRHYRWVMPTSCLMGVGDVVLVLIIIKIDSLWIGAVNGVAAGLGCMLAMWLDKGRVK